METTVVFDTYIHSSADGNNNYGDSATVQTYYAPNKLRYPIFYWDISDIDLTELKLKLKVSTFDTLLEKRTSINTSDRENYYPNNLTVKVDLFALTGKVNERTVTWNNAPKVELIKKDFLEIGPGQNLENQELVLDLTPYIDIIPNGIMLRINNYVVDDFLSKYYAGPNYPYYTFTHAYLSFHSSESPNFPVLIYNYGTKPLAPRFVQPEWGIVINKKATNNINFQWQSEGQTNYIFEYSQDNLNWTTLQGTTQKNINVPTASLNNGNLYARVKIKAGGLWSDYSQTWFLQIGEKPNTPIVSVSGITTSIPLVSWNANPLQTLYQVQILEGGNIKEDSGIVRGNTNNYVPKIRLESNKTYTFRVRIADKNETWSDWGSKAATITFAMPATPLTTLYLDRDRGSVLITIDNPSLALGEETTLHNEIYKKEDGEWIRVATNIQNKYIDYTIRHDTMQQYKVRAIGQSGYKDSVIKITELKMKYSDLAIVGEWDKYVKLKYNDTKKQNKGYTGEILKFSGRSKSVVEFEDNYNNEISLTFELNKAEDLHILQSIIDSRRTLLYRDSRGRKIYGSVTSKLDTEDLKFKHYRVGFTFTETDYSEVV